MKKLFYVVCFVLIIGTMYSFSAYAEDVTESDENVAPEFILGDADCNGKVNASDARIVLRVSAGLSKLTDIDFLRADYNEDWIITAADARYILRVSAGLDPFEKPAPAKSKLIKITPVGQLPDFPAGCESVAAVMNLNYYGFNVTSSQFIESFLPIGVAPYKVGDVWYGSDPDEAFLGDPSSEDGWGIWAKGLTFAINRYLDGQEKAATVNYTYDETLESLCGKYVCNDIPVLVWVTAGMEPPRVNKTITVIGTDKTYTWISPNHCMLLVGFDETGYYFNDPLTGKLEKYTKEASDAAFKGNGSQSVIIKADK